MSQIDRRIAEIVRNVTALQSKDITTLTAVERAQMSAWSQASMLLTMGELLGGAGKRREAEKNLHTLSDRCRHVFKRVTGGYVREERRDTCQKAVAYYDDIVGTYKALTQSAAEHQRLDQEVRENEKKMRALYDEQYAQFKAHQAQAVTEATVLQRDLKPLHPLKLRLKA